MRRTEKQFGERENRLDRAAALAIALAVVLASQVVGQTNAVYTQPTYGPQPQPQTAAYQATPAEDGARFRAYPLNQTPPDVAEKQLSQFFAAVPGIEIVADVPRNRVLVRGTPEVLQQAGEFLAKFDPPRAPVAAPANPAAGATGAGAAAADRPPVQQLEAYPLTPISKEILTALEKQASGRPDVRVAVDERSSQILVFAPDTIHKQVRDKISQATARIAQQFSTNAQQTTAPQPTIAPPQNAIPQRIQQQNIAAQFASPQPQAAPFQPTAPFQSSTPAAAPTTAAPFNANPTGPIQLRNLRAEELRVRLERLLARPLPASGDTSGQWQTFEIEAVPGAGVMATVNPTTGELHLSGPPHRTSAWRQVIAALDAAPIGNGSTTQLVATKPANHNRVRQVLQAVQAQGSEPGTVAPGRLTAMLQQQAQAAQSNGAAQLPPQNGGAAAGQDAPTRSLQDQAQAATDAVNLAQAAGELLGPVQIEFVEGLDVIVLRGADRDVERVMQIIEQIEELSAVTSPTVEVYPLKNVESRALGALLTRLYSQVLGPRIGDVSITPLVKPNALLFVGRPENVRMAIELAERLDQPVAPATRFEVFPLKNAGAADAKTMIDQFLGQAETEEQQQQGQQAQEIPTLAPQALVVADVRTNSLIVSASPRDLTEISALVAKIDSPSGAAVDQVRVFPLRNAVATEMAEVLRAAIQGQTAAGQNGEAAAQPGNRPSALEFRYIGDEVQRQLTSGVLTGARISADARANSIIVTAPADSMDLIAALIQQLDQAPNVAAELKVFTMQNGDAATLVETLRTLFGATEDADQQQVGGVGAGGLVRLQFSVDQRTNSVIAAGTRQDLAVVEAILLRLDEGDVRERTNVVYRLNNASAQAVSETLNAWLQTQREAETAAEVALSPFEQIEREVIIVPEIATNSLVVSATPRYFETVKNIIADLDERPPMVMIQVLIAEVRLNDTDEFGVELGLQDSLLFDRSLLSDVQTVENTFSTPGTGIQTTTQNIISSNGQPGYNFNSTQPLGNNLSTAALSTASTVATQGLSNFSMGRANPDLGFGGFIFSASSNGVNVLLRALQEKRRLEVLSRPQIMALDGQPGYILVGQRVPTITGVTLDQFGQTNNILYQQVGIIMQVRPRISPDGLVVMELTTEKSEVGPEAEGIPISVTAGGQIVRAPRINATTAVTTVSALSGQTVVLSGLLTNRREEVHRRVPLLADIPLIGDLFRYDRVSGQRTELLIVMTPQIVRNKLESDLIKQVESSRMSYIMTDVVNLAGDLGLRSRCDSWGDGEVDAVYPTYVPADGEVMIPTEGELLPTPAQAPPLEPQALQGPELEPTLARLPKTSDGKK
jgi:general secretion pathway protein D